VSAYTSLEAELHDAFWAAEGEPVELALLDELLREHPGPALEIGSGRLLLPLREKGHDVEGLELSPEMLRLCREAAGPAAAPVLHEGDMSCFDPGRRYRSLLLPAFTFQLAPDPAAAMAHFRRLLEPGGLLYLTVFIPLAELHGELPEGEWYEDHRTTLPDGRTAVVHTRHRIDRRGRVLMREHRYELRDAGGAVLSSHPSTQTLRWFSPRRLRALLERSGFLPVHALADFDPELPVDEDAQIVTVVARLVAE
jgi:SAM-dependent methyltransferase